MSGPGCGSLLWFQPPFLLAAASSYFELLEFETTEESNQASPNWKVCAELIREAPGLSVVSGRIGGYMRLQLTHETSDFSSCKKHLGRILTMSSGRKRP